MKLERATAGAQGGCSGICDVLPARVASVDFSAAVQVPVQVFSGEASVYFTDICLAFKVAVIQLLAQ